MKAWREVLSTLARGGTAFIGLGHPERGDDGLGLVLAEALARKLGELARSDLRVVVAGLDPARPLSELLDARFRHLVFLDAVDFGGEPGDVLLSDAAEMEALLPQVSTHRLSLGLLGRYIEARGARAWLLGVQPASLAPRAGLSRQVSATVEALVSLLAGLLPTREDAQERPAPPGPVRSIARVNA